MASLFDLLRDTMPMAAAEVGMVYDPDAHFDDLELDEVLPFLRFLEPDESYEAIVPALKATDAADDELAAVQRVWAWKHDSSDPAVIKDVWCRVRDAGYVSHKVLDSLEWGYEAEDTREFKKCVGATMMSGRTVELPLDAKFIASKWVVFDGEIQEDQTPLWRLKSRLDKGLLIAFVYEIDPDGQPQPWKPAAADREALDAARETSFARRANAQRPALPPEKELSPESPYFVPSPAVSEPAAQNAESWAKRVRKGDLLPRDTGETVVQGQVPSVQPAEVGPARILVVLSFSVCRERSDFEPGGIAGMGRLYPHVMFLSSVPLLTVEASVRYNRPEKTTPADPPDGLPGARVTCHTGFDAINPKISGLMVTDANESNRELNVPSPFPLPFWSNLFAYYLPKPHETIGTEAMRMVRTDRRWAREKAGIVSREIENSFDPRDLRVLRKEARQGEFDSIHQAPSFRLVGANLANVPEPGFFSFLSPNVWIDISDASAQENLKLNEIFMAPFCTHDCLHTHWRWGTALTKKASVGWDENGPYSAAGAPMVPVNQDVTAWMRGPSRLTYHARAGRDDGSAMELLAGTWQVLMHHGSAYALYITGVVKAVMAAGAVDACIDGGKFFSVNDEVRGGASRVSPLQSHAALYWHLRYVLEALVDVEETTEAAHLMARERTIVGSLEEARRL